MKLFVEVRRHIYVVRRKAIEWNNYPTRFSCEPFHFIHLEGPSVSFLKIYALRYADANMFILQTHRFYPRVPAESKLIAINVS